MEEQSWYCSWWIGMDKGRDSEQWFQKLRKFRLSTDQKSRSQHNCILPIFDSSWRLIITTRETVIAHLVYACYHLYLTSSAKLYRFDGNWK
jgi:hypothetical protein